MESWEQSEEITEDQPVSANLIHLEGNREPLNIFLEE